MEVVVGKTAGFCGGVFNSVKKTEEYLDEYGNLFCLGELVHNKHVVDKLSKNGLIIVDSLDDIYDSKVIVRAHGIPKETYEIAKEHNIELLDLTCPKVLKIHDIAKDYVNEGYYVVLIAKRDHPEAIGTYSYCGDNSFVLENDTQIYELVNSINNSSCNKVAIIAQTTFSVKGFNDLCDLIKNKVVDKEIVINNTICNATSIRQEETDRLSKEVDTMIIVGGKNSSNTKKLYEIAEANTKTYLVETVDELDPSVLEYETVGVMAGASTPKESIDEVIEYLNKEKL
jgi:4-hydroxy-3-methylbut-2-enyl diphosphate reductase